jgi:hypothetical protein
MALFRTTQGFRGPGKTSLFLKDFDRVPGFVWRLPFIFKRALKIHFCERIFRIELEKLRKEDFRVREVAVAELSKPGFIELEPLEKLPVPRIVFVPIKVKISTGLVFLFTCTSATLRR